MSESGVCVNAFPSLKERDVFSVSKKGEKEGKREKQKMNIELRHSVGFTFE